MPTWRMTVELNKYVMGGSEVYWYTSASKGEAAEKINKLMELRNQMLYKTVNWVGLRIAEDYTLDPTNKTRRKGMYFPPGSRPWGGPKEPVITVPATGTRASTSRENRPDQWRAVLQLQLLFGGNRQTFRYLSGIPDAVTSSEPGGVDFPGDPAWEQAFIAWRDYVESAGFAIRARTVPPADQEYAVSNLVAREAAPGGIGVSIGNDLNPNFQPGDRIHLRGFKQKPTIVGTINGQWIVDSVNNTLEPGMVIFWLRNSQGIDPLGQKILGTAQRVRHTIADIEAIHTYGVGIHKRGKPSRSPVGRRSTRVSLDP